MKRLQTAICLLLCTVGFTVGAASAQGQAIYFHGCGGSGNQTEPAEVVLTCADAKLRVEALAWSTWELAGASATGTLTYPDCPPEVPLVKCRDYAHKPVVFALSQAEYCPRYEAWVFTQALLIDENAPTPATRNSPFRFPCPKQPSKFFLSTEYGSSLMRDALSRRRAFAFSAGGARRVKCNVRVSRDRLKCRMSWFVGDLVFWGRGTIWITYPQGEAYWNFSYRVVRFNEYCAVVGGTDCTKVYVTR